MREGLMTLLIALVSVTTAAGQTSKFEIGPVVRADRVFFEAGASGSTVAAGVAATVRLSKRYAIEAEMTQGAGTVERSYEGWFVSYVTSPDATRAEIERLAPVARRSLGYAPGSGGSIAFRAGGDVSRRVAVNARVGATGRRYTETSAFTMLSIPAGVDPSRVARDHPSTSSRHWRGGLLLGLDTPVALTPRVSLIPEMRYVYGGPARVGDKYREFGLGLRAAWRF